MGPLPSLGRQTMASQPETASLFEDPLLPKRWDTPTSIDVAKIDSNASNDHHEMTEAFADASPNQRRSHEIFLSDFAHRDCFPMDIPQQKSPGAEDEEGLRFGAGSLGGWGSFG